MRTVKERDVLRLVDAFRGWSYSRTDVGFPWPLPRVRLPLVSQGAPRATNCCAFLAALLVNAFRPDYDLDHHTAWMIAGADVFGPISSAIELGLARPLAPEEWPGSWRLCQGWRADGGGHTFVVVRTEEDGRVLVLEANRAFLLNGVGYRDVGPRWGLGEAMLPAASATWTWARLQSYYPALRACALGVEV
jgi:hypothetical protein